MSFLDKFRKCALCRKQRPKDCAVVIVNGGNKNGLRICNECEKILDMSNLVVQRAMHGEEDEES